jgi:hypothetical protein
MICDLRLVICDFPTSHASPAKAGVHYHRRGFPPFGKLTAGFARE